MTWVHLAHKRGVQSPPERHWGFPDFPSLLSCLPNSNPRDRSYFPYSRIYNTLLVLTSCNHPGSISSERKIWTTSALLPNGWIFTAERCSRCGQGEQVDVDAALLMESFCEICALIAVEVVDRAMQTGRLKTYNRSGPTANGGP